MKRIQVTIEVAQVDDNGFSVTGKAVHREMVYGELNLEGRLEVAKTLLVSARDEVVRAQRRHAP